MRIDNGCEYVTTDAVDSFADIPVIQQIITLGVDSTALVVCHIIVFQQLFTDIKVAAFHFTLCVGNRFGYPRMLNRLTFFHTQFAHHAGNTVRGENTHQRIFHRQVEAGRTGITLTA